MSESLRGELLSLISKIKARVQDRIGSIDIPLPQFVVVGRQSVGKSRLLEALAGEQFNFVSGTVGSRRPTVLEFRNNPDLKQSQWSMYDPKTKKWTTHSTSRIMELVGEAHESLQMTVSSDPVYVKLESASCVDMLVTDLPGFRDFSLDTERQKLADRIVDLVQKFMKDPNNIMLCVEEAGDSATLSTLARCQRVDPTYSRTVLVRNKLDKYYKDLDNLNVNNWITGLGDLPDSLLKFCLSLPNWKDGTHPPKPFIEMRAAADTQDLKELKSRGASDPLLKFVGFQNFSLAMERKTEEIFAAAIEPTLKALKEAESIWVKKREVLDHEVKETDPDNIVHAVRAAGKAFARALGHVMEGSLGSHEEFRITLDDELNDFHNWALINGISSDFDLLPSIDFVNLDDYVGYLRDICKLPAMDVPLSGGAQYSRLKLECEIYFRFSDVCLEVNRRDVIQARGISIGQVSWQDVVLKLLTKEGQPQVRRKVNYVGSRIQWFFIRQKDEVINFMESIKGSPDEHLFSRLFTLRVQLIKENDMCRQLIFNRYDEILKQQKKLFTDLFSNTLQSTFQNPWALVKGSSWVPSEEEMNGDAFQDMYLPSFEDTKARIPIEISHRSSVENSLRKMVNDIPTDNQQVDLAVEKVQALMIAVFNNIRNLLCDQLELFADSFFQLPMIRHLEGMMSEIDLVDKTPFLVRRQQLEAKLKEAQETENELKWGISQVSSYSYRVGSLYR